MCFIDRCFLPVIKIIRWYGKSTATSPPPPAGTNDVDFWLTKSDQSVLLQKQSTVLSFGTNIKYKCQY